VAVVVKRCRCCFFPREFFMEDHQRGVIGLLTWRRKRAVFHLGLLGRNGKLEFGSFRDTVMWIMYKQGFQLELGWRNAPLSRKTLDS